MLIGSENRLVERCVAVNLGYESVVFESLGGMEIGGRSLLESILSQIDEFSSP